MLETVLRYPLVPVFYHADAAYAQRVVQACYEAGLRVFEFTNRGTAALAVFEQLVSFCRIHCPDLQLGIGTLYTADEAERFVAAGTAFVVQPCATTAVADVCRQHGVPWLPGAMTVREIYEATQLGAALVKVFPGNVLGPGFIKSLRGPLPNVPLMITGGVEPTEASLREWFGAGANVLGLGSQLFKNDDPDALRGQLTDLLALAQTLSPLSKVKT